MTSTRILTEFEGLKNEYAICRRKLESKCEALLILSRDLDQCRQERDQFKLMAEQVQERYQDLKRQLAGVGPRRTPLDGMEFTEKSPHNLAHLLCEMRDVNKALQLEVDDQKQKLHDAQGDIKLLREQIARQRVGATDEGINTRHFPAHEREELVNKLEASREEFQQLERDLQQVLDEKEELVTERDVYKNKFERLNNELNYVLKGDEKRLVDIDAMVMESKYLKERVKQMEEEKNIAMATLSKYKGILEKKKSKGIEKLGQSRSGGVVVTQKQISQLLEDKVKLPSTPQMVADLQSLAGALLETVNDKNLALSHQRKTNKLLGNRVSELEKKLKTLEVAGLWNVPGGPNLDRLKQECEEIRTLIPKQASVSSEDGVVSIENTPNGTPVHNKTPLKASTNGGLNLEDLDLLPTKEETITDLSAGDFASLCPTGGLETSVSAKVYSEDLDSDNNSGEENENKEDDPLLQGPYFPNDPEMQDPLGDGDESDCSTPFFTVQKDIEQSQMNESDGALLRNLISSAALKVTAKSLEDTKTLSASDILEEGN